MLFQCTKTQVMVIFKYFIGIWNLIWLRVFFFNIPVKATINLMRQMQKGGSSVWLFPLTVWRVKKGMWWSLLMHCVLWQQILLHYRCEGWGWVFCQNKKLKFSTVWYCGPSPTSVTLSFCHSWHPSYLEWLRRKMWPLLIDGIHFLLSAKHTACLAQCPALSLEN